jgi:hypothetical protein
VAVVVVLWVPVLEELPGHASGLDARGYDVVALTLGTCTSALGYSFHRFLSFTIKCLVLLRRIWCC